MVTESITNSGFYSLPEATSSSEFVCLVAESSTSEEAYIEVGRILGVNLVFNDALAPAYFMPIWLPDSVSGLTTIPALQHESWSFDSSNPQYSSYEVRSNGSGAAMGDTESFMAIKLLEPLAVIDGLSINDGGEDSTLSLYMSPYLDILDSWGGTENGNLIDFLLNDQNTTTCAFVQAFSYHFGNV